MTDHRIAAMMELMDAEVEFATNWGIPAGNQLISARIRYTAARQGRPSCGDTHDWLIRRGPSTKLARNICRNCGAIEETP